MELAGNGYEHSDALNECVALWSGDMTLLKFDAIVNAANSLLTTGGGCKAANAERKISERARAREEDTRKIVQCEESYCKMVSVVNGAIHRHAGTQLLDELQERYDGCETGDVVITAGASVLAESVHRLRIFLVGYDLPSQRKHCLA